MSLNIITVTLNMGKITGFFTYSAQFFFNAYIFLPLYNLAIIVLMEVSIFYKVVI